jgi:hypothetical protein
MNDFKLDNEPKISSGFKTPEDYFDIFTAKILIQLPKQEPKVISIFSSKKTWYLAAASVIILLLSVPLYNQYALNQQSVDANVLEDYLAYNTTVSEDDIVNLLDKEDLEKMKVDFNLQDKDIEEALESNSNLEQYILD